MNLNSLCYLGLGVLSIILLFYVCIKTGVRQCLLTFMAMVGFGYIIEGFIYNFFNSYQYYPNLINNPIYDSALGAIASNALSLPVAATTLAAFHKNWLWVVFVIGLYAGIENLFLFLHIYEHYWWKTSYTAIGLCFYFVFAKILYNKLSFPLKGFFHTFCLYLIISPISGTLHFLPIMLFSNRYYDFGLFANHSKDTTAFSTLFYLSFSPFYVLLSKIHLIPNKLKYLITPVCMYSVTVILRKVGILHSLVWWDTWYYVGLSCFSFLFTNFINRILFRGPSKSCKMWK